jgi:hypothetical protein
VQCTYYLSKIEPEIFIVVTYDKKKDNDFTIKEMLNTICKSLRLRKLFEQLQEK